MHYAHKCRRTPSDAHREELNRHRDSCSHLSNQATTSTGRPSTVRTEPGPVSDAMSEPHARTDRSRAKRDTTPGSVSMRTSTGVSREQARAAAASGPGRFERPALPDPSPGDTSGYLSQVLANR